MRAAEESAVGSAGHGPTPGYGALDRLTSVGDGYGSLIYSHNAAGNVTADACFDGTAYGYDGDGRLATVTRNGLAEASYGYDALQRRVVKAAGEVTRHFLHDPDGHPSPRPSRPG